jgi:hypothetical protein
MEYTAADTPQQIALVEFKFAYLSAKARAAMHAAGVPKERRLEFYPEVIMTMTKLGQLKLIIIKGINKTRIEHYGLPLPKLAQYLRTWGEVGTVQTGKDRKMGDRGVTCMFVSYTSNHKGDCYRMWNPKTKKDSETCDMEFLNRMYLQATENTQKPCKKKDPEDAESESVQQDKRGGYCNYGIRHKQQ